MTGVVGHLRTGANRALDTVEAGACTAIERFVRSGNRLQGSGLVEITNIASMVFIDPEKVVRLYVAHEVGAKDHARANFLLQADVHLDRAGSTVVGVVHVCGQAKSESLV